MDALRNFFANARTLGLIRASSISSVLSILHIIRRKNHEKSRRVICLLDMGVEEIAEEGTALGAVFRICKSVVSAGNYVVFAVGIDLRCLV